MPTVVIYDCESDGRPIRCPRSREPDFSQVQCTCACSITIEASDHSVFSSDANFDLIKPENGARYLTCWRDVVPEGFTAPFEPLLCEFDAADIIVGFNHIGFDFPLLQRYYGADGRSRYMRHLHKSLDIFTRVRELTGCWLKLNTLLLANGLESKSSDGAEAIHMWNDGRRVELEAYCMDDVILTAQLAMLPSMRVEAKQRSGPIDVYTFPAHVFGIGPALASLHASNQMIVSTQPTQSTQPTPPSEPTDQAAQDEAEWHSVFGNSNSV